MIAKNHVIIAIDYVITGRGIHHVVCTVTETRRRVKTKNIYYVLAIIKIFTILDGNVNHRAAIIWVILAKLNNWSFKNGGSILHRTRKRVQLDCISTKDSILFGGVHLKIRLISVQSSQIEYVYKDVSRHYVSFASQQLWGRIWRWWRPWCECWRHRDHCDDISRRSSANLRLARLRTPVLR